MGLFGSTSPFDDEVAAATDGRNEDWQKIMNVTDRAKTSSQTAKDCLTSILTRLRNSDDHVVLHAITLLDSCINNSGKHFLLNVASRDFATEFRKILNKSKGEIRQRLLSALRDWANGEFSKDPQLSLIPSLCKTLRAEGITFPSETQKKVEKTASVSRESTEDADLMRAIELSLKDSKEGGSPMSKPGSSLYPTNSLPSSLYPSTSFAPEGRKVRALYDFEAAEDGELTFKAGEIITIIDEADQNWWKGKNSRGEGLFPSNFVTQDLSVEPEQPKVESKRSVQFNDEVRVKKIVKEEVEINEAKMDKLLHSLHEADPKDPSRDPPEMRDLIDEVNAMGPLIDAELERVDAKAAQLNQLCFDLQGSINFYHSLMRDPIPGPAQGPSYLPKAVGYPYSSPQQPQLNGGAVGMVGSSGPSMYQLPGASLPHATYAPSQSQGPPHFHSDTTGRPSNSSQQYGPMPGGPHLTQQQQPSSAYMYPMGGPVPQQVPPSYLDHKPPLM